MNLTAFMNLFVKKGQVADLPAFGATPYDAGHEFRNDATGNWFRNIGSREYAMHVRRLVNRQILEEYFRQRPGIAGDRVVPAANTYNTVQAQLVADKNADFMVVGTNATSALVTHAAGGGLTLTTAGASGDQIILAPHTQTGLSTWNTITWKTDDALSFETCIKSGANITAATYWMGFKLTNTSVTATDADQCFFRYQDTVNSGKFQTTDYNNGTANTNDSGVAVAVSTLYYLKLVIDGNRVPRYYINGAFVKKGLALKTGASLIPYIGIQAGAVAAKTLNVRGLICGKSYND